MSKRLIKPSESYVVVAEEWCKGCRFCVDFCPEHILYETVETNSKGYHIVRQTDEGECIACEMCTMICPEFAIHVVTAGQQPAEEHGDD